MMQWRLPLKARGCVWLTLSNKGLVTNYGEGVYKTGGACEDFTPMKRGRGQFQPC